MVELSLPGMEGISVVSFSYPATYIPDRIITIGFLSNSVPVLANIRTFMREITI
jgi:hypothetical protein